ncbi:hypothetical protein EDB84DRAFT_1445947 [Lactarius hengduanensis]|nr:hypothetical protein EDB84DRAFT_1445947 [Lactarius hengduanensis]
MCPIWYAETIQYRNKQKGKEAQRNSRYACSVSSRLRATRGEPARIAKPQDGGDGEVVGMASVAHVRVASKALLLPPASQQKNKPSGLINDYRREFSWVVDAANKVRGRWRGGSHEGKEPAGKPKAHTARSPLGSWNTPELLGGTHFQ